MKLRVLTISKPYVAQAYRKKLVDLARDGRFVIGLVCPEAWGSQAYEDTPEPEIQTFRLPIVLNGKNHLHFYRGLEAVLQKFKPDIVNIEEEHYSLVTWQCLRLAKRYGAKSLFYTWQNINKSYPPPFRWIEQYVFRNVAAGVCGNSDAINILRHKGFQGPCPEIVQMGVDLARFVPADFSVTFKQTRRQQLGLDPDGFWLSFFGRLVPEKGIAVLLQSAAELRRENIPVKVLIAGDGPERGILEAQIQTLGLQDHVMIKPHIPSTEVAQWLQAMDVLCLPSLTRSNWKEQYGRILAEAMAAGTIPAGSNSGEIPKVIDQVGLITPEGDVNALSAGLKHLYSKPELGEQLRLAGRRRVEEHFSDKVVAAKFAELFLSL